MKKRKKGKKYGKKAQHYCFFVLCYKKIKIKIKSRKAERLVFLVFDIIFSHINKTTVL
jgi:hypothetical protein